jgi:nitronate monooxygenase
MIKNKKEIETKSVFPPLIIKGKRIKVPIIQGGMGVGVSLSTLASAVAREGGLGIVSSAGIDKVLSEQNKKLSIYEAVREEVMRAKANGGVTGINIMWALRQSYEDSVRAAIHAKADIIICGAGLPVDLPEIEPPGDTALVPIVSSARALEVICRKWERLKRPYRPDAVVLEGPLAGGHLGFKFEDIDLDSNKLENLFPDVKEMAMKYGDFPVIVAGGIYDHDDIVRFLNLGADGVQMGTRFLVTEESSATAAYKQAVINAGEADIYVTEKGSPCGLPFRVIVQSPLYRKYIQGKKNPFCYGGYVLQKDENGRFTKCSAKNDVLESFCICKGLLGSAGYYSGTLFDLYTVGTNGYRIKELTTVKALMDELTGKVPTNQ